VITIHQRYRQTDRQTTCDDNTALCTKVHRAVKIRCVFMPNSVHVYNIQRVKASCSYQLQRQTVELVIKPCPFECCDKRCNGPCVDTSRIGNTRTPTDGRRCFPQPGTRQRKHQWKKQDPRSQSSVLDGVPSGPPASHISRVEPTVPSLHVAKFRRFFSSRPLASYSRRMTLQHLIYSTLVHIVHITFQNSNIGKLTLKRVRETFFTWRLNLYIHCPHIYLKFMSTRRYMHYKRKT